MWGWMDYLCYIWELITLSLISPCDIAAFKKVDLYGQPFLGVSGMLFYRVTQTKVVFLEQ